MDKKTTLTQITAILRKWNPVSLLVLFSFLLLSVGSLQAQTLKADSSVPVLDVCADYQQFTVRIAKGNQPCPNGELKIELPSGFELEQNSINVDGNSAVITNQTSQEVTVHLNIPSGPSSQEIEVTFNVKALCNIIGSTADSMVTYTLSGCNSALQINTSEAINIRYAVLRISVNPDPIVGNIGDQLERTITIRNQGNGEISEFILDRTLGNGLTHVSYDYASLTAQGWIIDASNPNRIYFSGSSLKSGASIIFKEKVQIANCALTATNYEVYYGCSTKCTISGVNGQATHIINLEVSGAPSLSVTASATSPVLNCFNNYGTNTWTVKNNGSVATDAITFEIKTQDGINASTIMVNGTPATVVSSTTTSAIITIPALTAGTSATVVFDQYYPAPNGTEVNCASAPTQFSNGQNAFAATYEYLNACAPVNSGGNVSDETTYNYEGMHVGEVDIVGGAAFQADHLFTNFNIPSKDLNPGDKFVITVELSPDLAAAAFSFNGVNAVNVGGNKYELTFTYGTAPWATGDLDFSYDRLLFDIMLDCSASPDLDNLWYRVGGELRKANGGGTCTSVVFKCTETKLKGFCGDGPCPNGLQNGPAGINRVSLGHEVNSSGVPTVGTPSTSADVRTFITGDILEIYQTSTARVTNGPFNTVRLVVEKDPSANATLRNNSGKVVVNGITITSNAVVTQTASTYVLEYTVPTALANGDDVRLSLQIKAGSSSTGLKEFPAKSYLIDGTGEGLLCGRTYTATGFYVTYGFDFTGGTKSFVNCEESSNTATFSANILGFKKQDVIFNNEYRKLFVPTTAVLQVPHYITLTGVKVTIKNQPWIANPTTIITVANVNNAPYTLDLSAELKKITGSSLGGVANGIDYLDEGFELEITPIVTISECEPNTDAKNQTIAVTLNGNVIDGEGLTTTYTNTKNLAYNTGIGSLTLDTANNSNLGRLSPDGTKVSWVVKIESTGSRNFNSVWLAKSDSAANNNLIINSVEEVTNYNGNTVLSTVALTGNMYRLGDFTSGTTKYYLIKADVINCSVESLKVRLGYSCTSNDYPGSINDGCRLADKTLTHKTITSILQTTIVDQFNGSSAKPDLCSEIWYGAQLHNAGDSQLDHLKITIPLNSAPGLAYNNKFEISNIFPAAGGSATTWILGNPADAVLNGTNLEITLPASTALNTLERVQVKVYFKVDDCTFRSGAKHTITPSALNTCNVPVTNITSATTKRLLINGGSDLFPELREEGTTSVDLDPVLSTGGILRAVYNAEVKNSGEFGVNDVLSAPYQIALKLPTHWSIVGDPNAYLQPAGFATYTPNLVPPVNPSDPALNPDPDRGYVFTITGSVPVGQTFKFVDVPLKYTGTDITTLGCDYNFGDIKLTVFQNIKVANCVPSPACAGSGIDQVLYENILPMELPVNALLTIEPPYQTPKVCNPTVNGGIPTLADVPFEGTTTVYHLDWYENLQEATTDLPADRLPYNTPLVDGRTYYVINRFIVEGVCKSNIGTILVTFKDNNLQGTVTTLCSTDNQTYRVQVTLTGEAPFAVTGTGTPGTISGNVWTSDPLPATTPYGAGTPYNVTFTDANNCTPLNLTGVAPMCCTLEITCPAAVTIICGTSIDPSVTGMPVVDKACGNTSFVYSDSAMSSCVNGTKTFTRTFTVTDEQGNTETCTQIINITDLVDPIFNEALPQDITVPCASLVPAAVALTATDNCGTATVTFVQNTTAGTCANNFTVTRTWTATDGCGNTATHTQTITVIDDVAPTFIGTLPAAAVTVSCTADVPAAATLTATDNCGTATVTFNETKVDGSCANNFTLTRVWTAEDACGNTTTYTQVITVNDDIAPAFVGTLPANATVSCDNVPEAATLTATDNCGTPTVTMTETRTNGSCPNSYTLTRVYTAADVCGNSVSHTQVITVTDTVKPVFTSVLPIDITVSCSANVPAVPTVTAIDNCGTATVTFAETTTAGTCANNYVVTRTWTATDECGNVATHTQIITVADTVKPVFVEALPATEISVACDNIPVAETLTATDNCGTATITFNESRVNGLCANSYDLVRVWTATDVCGNTTTHTQTVKVSDTTKPVFVEALPANVTYSCSSEVPAAAALTATDNCGTATVTFNQTKVDGSCANSYVLTRTWTATDACGNATTHSQTITVSDTIAPVFVTLPSNEIVECDGQGNLTEFNTWLTTYGGSVATDNCGTVTMSYHIEDTNTICGFAGTVIVNFIATDECGNSAFKQGVFVIRDTTPPAITPASDLVIECSATGEDELNAWLSANGGSVANDICGAVTWKHDYQGVLTACAAPVLVTFTATDSCGNVSTTQASVSVVDTRLPILTKPAQGLTVQCGTNTTQALTNWLANHAGAEATDSCSTVTWTNNYSAANFIAACGTTGNVEVIFTGSDACGNVVTTTATFTIEDTTAPTLVKAAQNKTVECDGSGNSTELQAWLTSSAGATATDTCSTVTWTNDYNAANFAVLCGATGGVTVTFTATDACGNASSTIATFTIVDTSKPVFTIDPQNEIVECDGQGNLTEFNAWLANNAGATATDNCGIVTWSHRIEDTNTICGGSGSIVVDFTATDECGNRTTKQAVFLIRDTTAPSIDTPALDLTIECGTNVVDDLNAWLNNHGGAIATDVCGAVIWSHNYNGLTTTACGNTGSALVTFTATDACGNVSTTEATVSIVDTTLPVLTKQAQGLTVQCGANTTQALNNWLANHAGTEATDSCSTVTWTNNYSAANFIAACGNTGSVEVIFTGSDACGNVVTTTATFTIEDTTAPTLVKTAQNKTVECDGSGNSAELQAWLTSNAGATATDTCDANLTWTNDYNATNFAALCGATGSVTVTFTATDACGNSVSTIATFTIVDTTKPVFTTEPQNEVVECDGSGNTAAYNAWLSAYGNSVATDICGTVTYSYSVIDTAVLCGKTSKTTVKFTATDACGNKVIKQATFTIQDTMAPVITLESSALTIECGNDASNQINTWLNNHGGATSADDCGTVIWSHNYKGLTAACGNTGSALVTFTATDSCGNASTTQASVSVVDTVVPILTKQAQGLTVQCGANTTQALNNWLANHAGAEATDSCSTVTWTNNYNAANFVAACGATGSVEVIFTGSDACGNIVTTTATFTIEDTTAPTLVKAAQNKTVECDGSGNSAELQAWLTSNAGATATDICDANLTWTNDYNAANFAALCGATGSVTVTFTATDACGNSVSTIATFTIVDTTKPVFTTEPQNEVVECDGSGNTAAYNAWLSAYGNSVATDICGTVTYSYSVIDTAVLCGSTSKTTVQFTATDACGNNVSKQATFTIQDTTAPDFITEAQDLVVECDGTGNNSDLSAWLNNRAGATAKDSCSTGLTWTNNFTGLSKDCGQTGSATVIFTATDACGNTSETTATFTIVDTTAPVFNVNLPQDRTIECSDPMPEVESLTADDLCSKATVTFTEKRVDGNCSNNYEVVRTWVATDACGNTTEHVQTITVQDTTAPEFVSELPAKEIFIRCEDLKDAEVLKATDNCGLVTVTVSDEIVPSECGDTKYTILRTWTATDDCGNKTAYTQTIHLSCKIDVFNAVTPNGDGYNDDLELKGIECYPGNTVEIFNRWGVLVYETKDYNSKGNTFKGFANGRVTVSSNSMLPSGTYYYVIKYDYDLGNGQVYPIEQAGYLHLETNK